MQYIVISKSTLPTFLLDSSTPHQWCTWMKSHHALLYTQEMPSLFAFNTLHILQLTQLCLLMFSWCPQCKNSLHTGINCIGLSSEDYSGIYRLVPTPSCHEIVEIIQFHPKWLLNLDWLSTQLLGRIWGDGHRKNSSHQLGITSLCQSGTLCRLIAHLHWPSL